MSSHPIVKKRSACPALNILAENSKINYSGENISDEELVNSINEVFGLEPYISRMLIRSTKVACGIKKDSLIDLKEISKHEGPEHDASLFHDDYYINNDQSDVNPKYVEDLITLSTDGVNVTWKELIQHKKNRIEESKRVNPTFEYSISDRIVSYGEMFLLMTMLGKDGQISIEYLREMILEKKIPVGYQRSSGFNYLLFIYHSGSVFI